MNANLCSNKDFWAGVMLIATGVASVWIARNYPFGTAFRMGPGYFPTVLGGILAFFGLILLIRGLRSNEKITGSWSLRAMIILPLAFVAFGLLIERAGLVPALIAVIFVSAWSGKEFKFTEVVLLTAVVTLLSVIIFIWALELPYTPFVGF